MKRNVLWAGVLTLALSAGLVYFSPALHAQSQTQPPAAQQQPDPNQSRTFVGQIVQAKNGQFALLVDKNAGRGFYLDDAGKAKKYNGQNVKVTGKLDVQTKTIHVSDIQPMA